MTSSFFRSLTTITSKSNVHNKSSASNDPQTNQTIATSKSKSHHRPILPSPPNLHIDQFGTSIHHPAPAFLSSNHSNRQAQLIYGYTGLCTHIEIDLLTINQTIQSISQQLKSNGLELPLLFSTRALDVSAHATHSLVKSFLNNQLDFHNEIKISHAHNLSCFLKWILARHINPQGHIGLLRWDQYACWRESEKVSQYPPRFITTDLLSNLHPSISALLSSLLDLFATTSAYSHLNGMTVHKCAAIFGSYIFGLKADSSFEEAYKAWIKYSHGTEHLILAYIRDMKAQSTLGHLPLRMEQSIIGYPNTIPSLVKTHPSAKLEKVTRFRRWVRFPSKNLILQSADWDVKASQTWNRLVLDQNQKPIFSKAYRHLLNIQEIDESNNNQIGSIEPDFEDQQRYRSLVEKQWLGFMDKGFQEPDSNKLEFKLSERQTNGFTKTIKRSTIDWDSFTGNGFLGRESYTPNDLEFNTSFKETVTTWPTERKNITKKLAKVAEALPPFPYDITPVEQAQIYVDENFFEVWADVLISSGWSREEFKQVNWVLVNYKSKHTSPTLHHQIKNDDVWILFEEIVPSDYRRQLIENTQKAHNSSNKSKLSFLKSINNRKLQKLTPHRIMNHQESALEFYPSAPQRQNLNEHHSTNLSTLRPSSSFSPNSTNPPSMIASLGHDHSTFSRLERSASLDSSSRLTFNVSQVETQSLLVNHSHHHHHHHEHDYDHHHPPPPHHHHRHHHQDQIPQSTIMERNLSISPSIHDQASLSPDMQPASIQSFSPNRTHYNSNSTRTSVEIDLDHQPGNTSQTGSNCTTSPWSESEERASPDQAISSTIKVAHKKTLTNQSSSTPPHSPEKVVLKPLQIVERRQPLNSQSERVQAILASLKKVNVQTESDETKFADNSQNTAKCAKDNPFQQKIKKVSNIVDMFEQGEPKLTTKSSSPSNKHSKLN
ncbi:hypothetical protein O181_025062 [Austropuccinia psidii MF-1]|uniref:Meiotically up-regulated protein Msb1/Mug8 domain-containing protein n=1 Tax=Austropuccinia psidii MF-1 TaxID=1389203 RepID=A0A9Q3CKG0_9BASI|nr:hypothetical protein [Austropuccinia psidii MF-1]